MAMGHGMGSMLVYRFSRLQLQLKVFCLCLVLLLLLKPLVLRHFRLKFTTWLPKKTKKASENQNYRKLTKYQIAK